MKLRHLVLMIPWLAALAVVIWLFLIRFPLDGAAYFSFPLDHPRPQFDVFLPVQRATNAGVQPGGWTGQRITDEPVYASTHAPGIYDHVELSLEVTTTESHLALGLIRDPAAWKFELHPVLQDAKVLPDGWLKIHTSFELPFPQDELKFMISAPDIKQDHGRIDVRAVDIRYSRPPLTLGEWWRVMKREIFLMRQRLHL
jgi:hypothetical protein